MDKTSATKVISQAYSKHKETYTSGSISVGSIDAAYLVDLSQNPSTAKVLYSDQQTGKLSSFNIVASLNVSEWARAAQSEETIKNALLGFDGDDINLNDENISEYLAADAVADFGLFGVDAQVGVTSFNTFIKKLEKQYSADEFEAIKSLVDEDKFSKMEAARLRRPLSSLQTGKIHKDAVKSVKAVTDYDWNMLRFYGRNDERGLLRRQAAESYPSLAHFFAHNTAFSRHVIEKKLALNAEISTIFGVPEKSLKPLRGKSWPSNGLSTEEILRFASSIPPDWFPKTQEDWDSFTILCKTIGRRLGREFETLTSNPLEMLFKGSKGQWREFHKRCAISFSDDRPPQGIDPEFSDMLKKKIDWKALAKAAAKSKDELEIAADRQIGKFTSDTIYQERPVQEAVGEALPGADKLQVAFRDEVERDAVREWIIRKNVPDMSEHFMDLAVSSTMELVDFMRDYIILPAAGRQVMDIGNVDTPYIGPHQMDAAKESAIKLLFLPDVENVAAGKTAPIIFENTRYFLNDMARIVNQVTGSAPPPSTLDSIKVGDWAPLFDGRLHTPNEMYFECITNSKGLTAEGKNGNDTNGIPGLSHCVGGYTNNCRDQGEHIIGLRQIQERVNSEGRMVPSFRRVATLQIRKITELDDVENAENIIPNLQTGQFYSINDTRPSDECYQALEWFLASVRAGDVRLNTQLVADFMKAVDGERRKTDMIQAICKYEYKETENITNAMMAVGRLVHKGVTKDVRSATDLMNHDVIASTVNAIDLLYGSAQKMA